MHPSLPVTITKPIQALNLRYVQTSSPNDETVDTAALSVSTKMLVRNCFFAHQKEEINSYNKQTNVINRFENYTSQHNS